MTTLTFALGAAAAIAGVLLGLGYFALLKRSVGQLVSGGWKGLALTSLARITVAVIAFFLLARLGAIPLVCAAAGFLLARLISVRRVQREI